MAAVRAVEKGERSATEFFTRPVPPPAPSRTAPAPSGPANGTQAPAHGPATPPPAPSTPADGLAALLAEGGAPAALAGPVTGALGARAAEVLRSDPWALLTAPGVRPEQADTFARALLQDACGPGDERRGRALAGWLLERAARRGDTVRTPEELCRDLAGHAVPDPAQALEAAVEAGAVLLFEDPVPGAEPDEDGRTPTRALVGLDRYAVAEESLADGLLRLRTTYRAPAGPGTGTAGAGPEPDTGADTGAEADATGPSEGGDRGESADGGANDGDGEAAGSADAAGWQRVAEAAPSASARELIEAAAGHGVVTHTGGAAARAEPAALVAGARSLGLRAVLAAHTATPPPSASDERPGEERAERPTAGEGAPETVPVAEMLHGPRALPRDEEGALALDVLAVLDADRLDTEAAAALVEALPDGARLVLSGDPGLLGSAGAGRVLADLIASGTCPRVVSRTPDPGPVGELVSMVGTGELGQVEAPGKEVVVVPVRDPGEALHRAVQLVTESIPRAFGGHPSQTAVITAAHGGPVGTVALNAALKERLNPGPGRFGGFDSGDRVAWSAAPGQTVLGTVVGADGASRSLECETGSGRVSVPAGEVSLRHGWAITAHQAAGHEWPAAVVVVPGDAGGLLDRAWVLTAFSRARRHLSVVQGAGPDLARAVAATPAARTTRLAELLRQPDQR
ncbi:ATP-binding domain-containing protein [Streptomyces otsuchiensis]|uniref:ATP-binding domain-containing protein n=1 Tax=Streptomyces otsuchiensis TaxID=2681388 RepID=UPI0010315975